MANAVNSTKYVSLDRTIEFLKLTEEEVQHAISQGNLRAYRDDDQMKFRIDDVRKFHGGKKKKKKQKNDGSRDSLKKVSKENDGDKSKKGSKNNDKTQERLNKISKNNDRTQERLNKISGNNDKTQDRLNKISKDNDGSRDKLKKIEAAKKKKTQELEALERTVVPTVEKELPLDQTIIPEFESAGKKNSKKKKSGKSEDRLDKVKADRPSRTNDQLSALDLEEPEDQTISKKRSSKKKKSGKSEDRLDKVKADRPSRTNDQLSALDLEEPKDSLQKKLEEDYGDYEIDDELEQFMESTAGEDLGSFAESKAYVPKAPKPPPVEDIPVTNAPKKEKFMIAGGLFVIVALILFVNFKSQVFFQKKEALSIQVGELKKGDITVVTSATGEVQPLREANIYAKVSGIIETITVQEGQKVTRQQPLAYLTSEELDRDVEHAKNQLAEAKSRYDGAVISMDNAKEEYEREKEKLKIEDQNLINQIAQSESDIRTIEYNMDKVEKELRIARKGLENEEELAEKGFSKQQDVDAAKQKLEDAKTHLKVKAEELKKARIKNDEIRNKLKQSADTKLSMAINTLKSKQNQLDTEKIRVAKAESELKNKEAKLKYKVIRSTIAGVVSKVDISPGDYVSQGSRGADPLFVIFNEKQMEIHSLVDEIDIHDIKKNQEVSIEIEAIPGAEFQGHVSSVATTASKNRKGSGTSFAVKIKVDKGAERMKPGLSANIGIITQNRKNILKAPQQSVVTRTESELTGKFNFNAEEEEEEEIYKVIFVFEKGKAVVRKVKTGISDDTYVEILGGISIEDSIITGPYRTLDKLKAGSKVKLMNASDSLSKSE